MGTANADLFGALASAKNISLTNKVGAFVNATLAAKNATPFALPLELKEKAEYAVTSKIYSLPSFTQAVNFVQVPEKGVSMTNTTVTLRGVEDVEWYYLYPNVGNGYMSTLQWVNRMTSKYLYTGSMASFRKLVEGVTRKKCEDLGKRGTRAHWRERRPHRCFAGVQVPPSYSRAAVDVVRPNVHTLTRPHTPPKILYPKPGAFKQATAAELAGNPKLALQLYELSLAFKLDYGAKFDKIQPDVLKLVANGTLTKLASVLPQNVKTTKFLSDAFTALKLATAPALSYNNAVRQRRVSANVVVRNAVGAVTDVRRIIMTELIAFDPIKKDLTFNYVNAPGGGFGIAIPTTIDAIRADAFLLWGNPLPSTAAESPPTSSFSPQGPYVGTFVATANSVVVSGGNLVLTGVDLRISTMTCTVHASLKEAGFVNPNTIADITTANPVAVHMVTRTPAGRLLTTLNPVTQSCTWNGPAATLTCPLQAVSGKQLNTIVGGYTSLAISFSVNAFTPQVSRTSNGGRRLLQATQTCSSTSQNYSWTPTCTPPYIGTGFSSVEQESFPGADASGATVGQVSAASSWLMNSLPIFTQESIYQTLQTGGGGQFGPLSIGTYSYGASSYYSSKDTLTNLQQSQTLDGFYDGVACSASESFQQTTSTFTSTSTFNAQGSLFTQVATASLPNLSGSAILQLDPTFFNAVVAAIQNNNAPANLMSIYQSYGDSVVIGASVGGYELTSMAASASSLASSVSTGVSVSLGIQASIAESQSKASYSKTDGWTAQSQGYSYTTVYAPSAFGAPNYTCTGTGCTASADYSGWFTTLANANLDGMWLTQIQNAIPLGVLFSNPSWPIWTNAQWPSNLASTAEYSNALLSLGQAWNTFVEGCTLSTSSWSVPTLNRYGTEAKAAQGDCGDKVVG